MKLKAFVEGIGLGALSMYLLDPERGPRRRVLIRDQVVHQVNTKRTALDVMVRDLRNRVQGLQHEVQQRFDDSPAPDSVLPERVRAALGRVVSHCGSLEVSAQSGVVTIAGPILAQEVEACLKTARMVPGVKHVVNSLDVHETPDHVPGLQGQANQPIADRWTPATCLTMAGVGLFMNVYGMGRKGSMGGLMRLGGAAMIAKAFHDTEHRFDPNPNKAMSRNQGRGGGQQPSYEPQLSRTNMIQSEPVTERGPAGMR
ncbi:MAG: hypothetical protein QOJ65_1350 [Fimbriimonadaceae bacterium]|jgi:hypothetical protein|nr:hypothetical protein [Fimbriimonadaceae bacterium]